MINLSACRWLPQQLATCIAPALTGLALLTTANLAQAHAQTFATAATYNTGGTAPRGTALGDVNADGRLDIVTANYGSSNVSVLLGQAGGTFAAATTYACGGTGPLNMALGDVNADGQLDIVTANYGSSSMSVLLPPGPIAAPTLTSLSPTNGSVGITLTLTGTNLTGATAVSFNGTAALTYTVVNATTITVTVPAGTTTGNVTITTPDGTSNGLLFTVTYPDLVVSTKTTIPGGIYNTITVTGSGILTGNVTVNTSVIVQNGGGLNDGCFVLSGAGSFTLAAGGTLYICSPAGITPSGTTGTVQLAGTRSFSTDASYVYNGTAAQVTGTGLPAQVRQLSIYNASNVTLSAPSSVSRILIVGSTGNLVLNGQPLTLIATPTTTALVMNYSTGIVSGSTAVDQIYLNPTLNAGLGYRHLSAPVAGATVANFTTASFTPEVSQGSAYNASATPGTVTPFPTVFNYDQSRLASVTNNLTAFDKGFTAATTTASSLDFGVGYAVNMGAGQVVSFPGQLFSGPGALTLARNATGTANAADAGWQLLGNPYPSYYDYSRVTSADRPGLDPALYVFNSASQYGGTYSTYLNGQGNNAVLLVGQAFWVRVSSGQTAGTLYFRNNYRQTSLIPSTVPLRGTADSRPLVQLELRGATGPTDALYAYAEAGATPAFDAAFDAVKRTNTTGLNLASLATTGEALAIDGRPVFSAATVLPLTVGVPAAGTYSLSAAALRNLPAGLDAFLSDAITGQTVNLSQQPAYKFSVTTAQAAALLTDRFALSFAARSVLATAAALTAAEVTLYPNPAHAAFTVLVPAVAGASLVQATLFNALGQMVRQQAAALPAAGARLVVETADLAAGIYTLRLQVGATTLAKRVILQ